MTAKDYFPDWYRKANPTTTVEEVQLRMELINKLLKKEEKTFWKDIINLALGVNQSKVTSYKDFIDIAKELDPLFPVSQNNNLVQILSSCLLNFKLEQNSSNLNTFIALAIKNSSFLKEAGFLLDTEDFASSYLNKFSISQREVNIEDIEEVDDYDLQEPSEDWEDSTSYFRYSDGFELINKVNSNFDEVQQDRDWLLEKINFINLKLKTLSEESNILWWLFGENSRLLKKTFSEVGVYQMSVLAGKELADLTQNIPGHFSSVAILDKVLRLSLSSSTEFLNFSLYSALSSLDRITREKIHQDHFVIDIKEFSPCLLAISNSLEVDDEDDWSTIFKRQSNGLNAKTELKPLDIAIQVFNEILMQKAYKA